ncbi:MAG: hypothetical protein IJ773_07240 [Lachnospiraceae bacterium]|nr:hypothetical protein [Lachnospiraceae bacterium]
MQRNVFFFAIICFIFALSGCRMEGDMAVRYGGAYVVILEGEGFTLEGENRREADENGTVSFALLLKDGFTVEGINYNAAEWTTDGDRVLITLYDVRYPVRLSVNCTEARCQITYDTGLDVFTRTYSLAHHIRPNTENGETLFREGYTLIGWNTMPNGSGEHIGLGSRMSVPEDGELTLYAEWEPWTEVSAFTYEAEEESVTITGCSGIRDVLCIPALIDGKPVERIERIEGVFTEVVLPATCRTVAPLAFAGCTVKELTLFDGLEEIYDDSFLNCDGLITVHINAIVPPVFIAKDRHANLADKYDILIASQDAKKMVVYSGSSAYYSVDTKQMEEAFPEYVVINMAVNAYFNGAAQMEMMEPYLKEGDLFLHMPECVGESQLCSSVDMSDIRFFMALEANYDLISLVDLTCVTYFWNGFAAFLRSRKNLDPVRYSDYADFIDDRGNYAYKRLPYGKDESISGEARIDLERFSDKEAMERLNGYYERLTEKGVRVLLSNAPVNRQALLKVYGPGYEKLAEEYDAAFVTATHEKYPLLLSLSECVFDGHDFYNTDFHLSSEATGLYTGMLIDALLPIIRLL